MTITRISCKYSSEDKVHNLTITTNSSEYSYSLESAMVMDFGLIHSITALINLMENTRFLWEGSKEVEKEIKVLNQTIEHITRTKQ